TCLLRSWVYFTITVTGTTAGGMLLFELVAVTVMVYVPGGVNTGSSGGPLCPPQPTKASASARPEIPAPVNSHRLLLVRLLLFIPNIPNKAKNTAAYTVVHRTKPEGWRAATWPPPEVSTVKVTVPDWVIDVEL